MPAKMPANQLKNNGYLTLQELSREYPYSQEYLSLLARRGEIKAKKFGRNWYATKKAIDDYIETKGLTVILPMPASLRRKSKPVSIVPKQITSVKDKPVDSVDRTAAEGEPRLGREEKEFFKTLTDKLNNIDTKANAFVSHSQEPHEKLSPDEREFVQEESRGFFYKFKKFNKKSKQQLKGGKKNLLIMISAIVLIFLIIGGISFGNTDAIVNGIKKAFKDATTLQGHWPGTHANEVLLLDKEGDISIYGHIETKGQLRSWVKDGIAPIVVDSTTMVENLNAEMLGGLKGEEFTLAFVTNNGNVTTEDVFLEGNVEVGKTLLVKGATRLLDSLLVNGSLGVWGDIVGKRNLKISGTGFFGKDLLINGNLVLEQGTIKIKNTALIPNLNADMVDSKHASDFTLDFVVRQNNETSQKIKVGGLHVTGFSEFDTMTVHNGGLWAQAGAFSDGLGVGGGFSAYGPVELGIEGDKTVTVAGSNWKVDEDGNIVVSDITSENITAQAITSGAITASGRITANALPTEIVVSDASLYVNPASASTDYVLFGIAVNGTEKLKLDAEGDLTIAGSFAAATASFTNISSSSVFYAQDGTVTSPSFSFSADTNTGLYRSGTDTLNFVTSGSERLIIDSSGNVGIGTTNPDAKLTVSGDVRSSSAFKDVFGWNTNSLNKALLSFAYNNGGFSSSIAPGTNFNNASNWSVYDITNADSNAGGAVGAAFDGRYIYFSPWIKTEAGSYHGYVARYDTADDFSNVSSWDIYDVNNVDADAEGYQGAVFDGRYVYFVPYYSASGPNSHITRYDTTGSFTDASSWSVYDVSVVDAGAEGFVGAVFDNRYVYFVPYYNGSVVHGHVTRYDTTSSFTSASSWSVYDVNDIDADAEGFEGAVFDGRYVYLVPYYTSESSTNNGHITRYDTTSSFTSASSWSVYDVNDIDADAEGYHGAVFDGRYVYFVPRFSSGGTGQNGHITRYDTIGSFTDASSWSVYDVSAVDANAEAFQGGSFDGRYIYFCPALNGYVTKYDTTGSFTDASSWSVYDVSAVDANAGSFFGTVFDGRYVYFIDPTGDSSSGVYVTRYDTGSPAPMLGIHQLAKTNQFYINSQGSVGIGTTAPNTKLSILGTASISQDLWASGSFQFGGGETTATASYSRLGATGTSHNLSNADDLMISGDLEIDGSTYFDGGLFSSASFYTTGNLEVDGTASISDDFYVGDDLLFADISADYLFSSGSFHTTSNLFVDGTASISDDLTVGDDIYATKISPLSSSLHDVLLMGQGLQTPVFTDSGVSFSSHPTNWSTIISLNNSYTSGQILKNDIVIITNATDPENNGMASVVGLYPTDVSDTQIEIGRHLTLSGTADIAVYSKTAAIDRDGHVSFQAHADAPGSYDDSDLMFRFGYEHDLSGKTPGNVFGVAITDYNRGTDADKDFPLYIYRYDYTGAPIFYVNGYGDTYVYRNLNVDGNVGIGIGTNTPGAKLDMSDTDEDKIKLGDIVLEKDTTNQSPRDYGFDLYSAGTADLIYLKNDTGSNRQALVFADGAATNDVFGFSVSGDSGSTWNPRLVIQQDGNVGIGTTNPLTELSIVGTASISQDLWASGSFQFGGGEGIATASYSRLGATGTSHNLSNADDLMISGDLEIDGSTYFDGGLFSSASFYTTGNLEVDGTASISDDFYVADDVLFIDQSEAEARFKSTALVVASNSYVGVGTSDPSVNFEVDAGATSGTIAQLTTTDNAGYLTLTANARTVRFGADGSIGPHFGSTVRGGLLFPDENDMLPMIGLSANDKGVNLGRSGYNFGTIYAQNAVFNEDGDDVDFLIEASGEPFAFFVQGSDGFIGLGTGTPDYRLEVDGTASISDDFYVADDMLIADFSVNEIYSSASWDISEHVDLLGASLSDWLTVGDSISAVNNLYLTSGVLDIDGTASSTFAGDLDIEGDVNIGGGDLYVDASSGHIGIGTNNPGNHTLKIGTSTIAGSYTLAVGGPSSSTTNDIQSGDNTGILFGGTTSALLYQNQTFDQFLLGLGSALGRQLVIGDAANRIKDHDHAAQPYPTLFIHSSTSPDIDNTEWLSFAHDGTNASVSVGQGGFLFSTASASEAVYIDIDGNIFSSGSFQTSGNLAVDGTASISDDFYFGNDMLWGDVSTDYLYSSSSFHLVGTNFFVDAAASISGNLNVDNDLIVGGTILADGVYTSDSIDFDEIVDAATLDANWIISGDAYYIQAPHVSASEDLETGTLHATTIGSDSTLTINAFTLGGDITGNSKNVTGLEQLTVNNLRLDGNTLDTISGDLTLDSNSGTTLINDTVNVGSGVFYIDSSTSRAGINTTNLEVAFEVEGMASISGNLQLGGIQQTEGTNSSSFAGIVDFAGVPIGTGVAEGSVLINPTTAGVNNTLFGIAIADVQKLKVDAEGDLELLGVITPTGSGTSQFTGNLQVDGNTTIGSDISDTVIFNAGLSSSIIPSDDITYNLGSETKRFDSFYVASMSVENFYADGTASASFIINALNATADTEDSSLQFERGTTTPNAILKWDSTNDRFDFNNFPVRFQNRLIVDGTSTSSFAGLAEFNKIPISTDIEGGTLYINPSSGTTDYTIFGVAVNNSERFKVDAEGDATVYGALGVENQIFDVTQDTLTILDDLQIDGNDIKDSGSNTRITLGDTTTITATTTVLTGALTVGGTILADGVYTSDSIDFDEIVDAATLDADWYIADGGFGIYSSAGFHTSSNLYVDGTTSISDDLTVTGDDILFRPSTDATDAFIIASSGYTVGDDYGPLLKANTTNNSIVFKSENDAATPTLAFGDGNTGLYELGEDSLAIAIGGGRKWFFDADELGSPNMGQPRMMLETASDTNPVYIPSAGDIDTGIGWFDNDTLSFIGGSTELMRLGEVGGLPFVSIGTATSSYTFAVDGTASISGSLDVAGTFTAASIDYDGVYTSDSIDFDEIVDAATLDANWIISGDAYYIKYPHASISEDLTIGDTTVFTAGSIDSSGTLSINTTNNQAITLGTGLFTMAGPASASADFSVGDSIFYVNTGSSSYQFGGTGSASFAGSVNITGDLDIGTGDLFVDDSQGYVGIGAISPLSSKLHINGGTGTLSTGLSFGDGDTGIYESGDDALRIGVAGYSDVIQIANTGALTFDSTTSISNDLEVGSGIFYVNVGSSSYQFGGTGSASFAGDIDLNGNLNVGGNDIYVDDSSGYVGIGTNNPGYPLEVSGATDGGARGPLYVKVPSATGYGAALSLDATLDGGRIYNFISTGAGAGGGAGDFAVYGTNIGYTFRVDNNANMIVGINQYTPLGMLSVYPKTAGYKGVVVKGFASQTANLFEWQDSAGTILGSVDASGNLAIDGTASISDDFYVTGDDVLFRPSTDATDAFIIASSGYTVGDDYGLFSIDTTNEQILIGDGTKALPIIAPLNNTDMGIHFSGSTIYFSINNWDHWFIDAGGMGSVDANRPLLRATNTTATTPNIHPNKSDTDTGLGSAAADQLSLIAGGLEGIRITEAASAITVGIDGTASISDNLTVGDDLLTTNIANGSVILKQEQDATTPTLAFGDGDTGFYEYIDDSIVLALSGSDKWAWYGGNYYYNGTNGPKMMGESATITNPVWSFVADEDTGLGWADDDTLSLVAGGMSAMQLGESGGNIFTYIGTDGTTATSSYTFAVDGTASISDDFYIGNDLIVADVSESGVSVSGDFEIGATKHLIVAQHNDAVTPTFAFGDGDTGFYESADDTLNVAIAGAQVLTFDSNGRVGLGTETPVIKFHILGDTYDTSSMILERTTNNAYGPYLEYRKSRGDGVSGQDGDYIGGFIFKIQNQAAESLGYSNIAAIAAIADDISLGTEDGTLLFGTAVGGVWDSFRMVIKGSNVGIGDSTPDYKLSVDGTASISDDLYVGDDTFFVDQSTGRVGINDVAPAGLLEIQDDNSEDLLFAVSSSSAGDYFAVASTGYIGIGTTDPSQPIHIVKTGVGANFYGERTDGAFVEFSATQNYGYIGTRDATPARFRSNLVTGLEIATDGGVLMAALLGGAQGANPTVWYNTTTKEIAYDTSSSRYKKNIKDLENTSWIYDLRPRLFDEKDGSRTGLMGLIAEDVEKIRPDLVFYKPAKKTGLIEDSTGEMIETLVDDFDNMILEGVGYQELITPMLAEVQKHEQRIEELETILNSEGGFDSNASISYSGDSDSFLGNLVSGLQNFGITIKNGFIKVANLVVDKVLAREIVVEGGVYVEGDIESKGMFRRVITINKNEVDAMVEMGEMGDQSQQVGTLERYTGQLPIAEDEIGFVTYARQTAGPEISVSGNGQLEDGEAKIIFDSSFKAVINPSTSSGQGYQVILTPTSETELGLYVAEKTIDGFLVRGFDDNLTFDWLVIASLDSADEPAEPAENPEDIQAGPPNYEVVGGVTPIETPIASESEPAPEPAPEQIIEEPIIDAPIETIATESVIIPIEPVETASSSEEIIAEFVVDPVAEEISSNSVEDVVE